MSFEQADFKITTRYPNGDRKMSSSQLYAQAWSSPQPSLFIIQKLSLYKKKLKAMV